MPFGAIILHALVCPREGIRFRRSGADDDSFGSSWAAIARSSPARSRHDLLLRIARRMSSARFDLLAKRGADVLD